MSNQAPRKAYVYVEMDITDPEGFKHYTARSAPAVAAFGGRYIVIGKPPEVIEGDHAPKRVVLVELDSPERAREFYESPAYREPRKHRAMSARFNMLLLGGAPAPVA